VWLDAYVARDRSSLPGGICLQRWRGDAAHDGGRWFLHPYVLRWAVVAVHALASLPVCAAGMSLARC